MSHSPAHFQSYVGFFTRPLGTVINGRFPRSPERRGVYDEDRDISHDFQTLTCVLSLSIKLIGSELSRINNFRTRGHSRHSTAYEKTINGILPYSIKLYLPKLFALQLNYPAIHRYPHGCTHGHRCGHSRGCGHEPCTSYPYP